MILPVAISYDALRQKVMDLLVAAPANNGAVRDIEVYPSQGNIVIGVRLAQPSDGPDGRNWVYLVGTPQVDSDMQSIGLPQLAATVTGDSATGGGAASINDLIAQLRQNLTVSYEAAYHKLLDAANQRLTRPLKNGFRMEGAIESAKLDRVLLLAAGLTVALHVSGNLKIVYGL